MTDKHNSNIRIKNKRAAFDYFALERFTAGIQLTGTEIKSIRAGKASLVDTFCIVDRGEVWLKNMYVAPYAQGSYNNHASRRDRKLLLQKKEIARLASAAKEPGISIIPFALFINPKGLAKVDIALARGKKEYDKRQSIREKEDRREMAQAMKRRLA